MATYTIDKIKYGSNTYKLSPEATEIMNLIYPIGSIYMSVNNVSPQTFLGGKWQSINGRFLVAQGSNGASGDEALNITAGLSGGEASHKLTDEESGLPVHGHGGTYTRPTVSSSGKVTAGITGGSHSHNTYYTTANRGSGNTSTRCGPFGSNYTAITTNSETHTQDQPNHTHTLTGGGYTVADAIAQDAANAHNNLPPYLAVYMWKRTA